MKNVIYIILLMAMLGNINLQAQSETHESVKDHSTHSYQNEIAVFIGATSQSERPGTHFTLGADYLRLISPDAPWALGIYGEAIFAEHTEWVAGVTVLYLVTDKFWLRTGPGVEILQEAVEGSHDQTEKKTEFLYRVGMGYSFHLGGLTIAPSLDFDFVRHHDALVWGINVGKAF